MAISDEQLLCYKNTHKKWFGIAKLPLYAIYKYGHFIETESFSILNSKINYDNYQREEKYETLKSNFVHEFAVVGKWLRSKIRRCREGI